MLAILFGFISGYATLAEPALNAGATVEKITVGAFKKNLLMLATGVPVLLLSGNV